MFHQFHQHVCFVAQACVDVCSCVSFCHGVQGFIVCIICQIPDCRVSGTCHDCTHVFQSLECVTQVRPYSDTFPLDTCFFCAFECVDTCFQVFFQFVSESFECDFSIVQRTACYDQSHVVEQVETIQRRGFIFCEVSDSVPLIYGTLCLVFNFLEFLPIERSATDYFQLRNSISEFVSDICFCIFRNRHCVVERYVDYDAGNIQFYCKVFIPFQQCVTNVVTCDNQVGQRNSSCGRVNQNFRFYTCDCSFFQAFHVTHVYSTIRTAVDVVAFSFCYIQHIHSTFSSTDTSCMCFGINHSDAHGYAEFRRSYRSRPTYQVASFFCFSSVLIGFVLIVA